MEKPASGPRPLGLLNAVLAFGLSAAMGLAFVMVVNKTHDLFASAAFTEWIPNAVTSLGWEEQALVGTWEARRRLGL